MSLQQQQNPDGSWEWSVDDGLGSLCAVADSTNTLKECRIYDPYGSATQQSQQTVFGFTGEETDSNGLVYLRARYYNPAIGQFFNLDPFEGDAGQPLSLNRYGYVQGNPINVIDPSGLDGATQPLCLSMLLPQVNTKSRPSLKHNMTTTETRPCDLPPDTPNVGICSPPCAGLATGLVQAYGPAEIEWSFSDVPGRTPPIQFGLVGITNTQPVAQSGLLAPVEALFVLDIPPYPDPNQLGNLPGGIPLPFLPQVVLSLDCIETFDDNLPSWVQQLQRWFFFVIE